MPTSAYPLAFPKALASWAISPVWACGWLPAPHLHLRCKCRCLWRAPNGLLCSAYPFRVTLGRCFMPGLFASEHLSTMCPIGLETVPFWVQPAPHLRGLSSGFGWFRITTPQRTFSYLVHSHFPNRVHRPVRLLWLFFPLSTCVYQSHAEGRGCLPFTGEAGVDWIPFHGIIDLHGYAVTKIKRPSPLIPHSQEWFRANRSHTQRSKNVQRSCGKDEGSPSCVGAVGGTVAVCPRNK